MLTEIFVVEKNQLCGRKLVIKYIFLKYVSLLISSEKILSVADFIVVNLDFIAAYLTFLFIKNDRFRT